ncbi:MAG: (Fe-S)-binding protein [Gammaproteobacteria bacterium]|nr:(Fe-S)-binding protein [Gammaproteobacteria bacterium]
MDISAFLLSIAWPSDLTLRPLDKQAAVHDPCSMTHVLHQQQAPYRLLEKIPGITLLPLPDNRICCGAAGRYMVTHPEMSNALLADKISRLQQLKPDLLVTSNYGCAMHLRSGLQQAGAEPEIIHPVTLLAQQIA